jgi:hypothetical protein
MDTIKLMLPENMDIWWRNMPSSILRMTLPVDRIERELSILLAPIRNGIYDSTTGQDIFKAR